MYYLTDKYDDKYIEDKYGEKDIKKTKRYIRKKIMKDMKI